ncbi:translational GTPase TypA [Rubinisphaera sp.]|uniref:translational GTPase TypA n=1 Tax=Rubinisphaera sp. TaxID=2024857 RepID=UPI000C0FC4ED|nr:translational GTPase TypA [Rubinisphaera sp.]MBV08040.1 translational GTPase TypA [Rubinisphaera sp.]HCS54512.1 translational GTPase TypA [Planctomycetaceae bacterium]|tara:strand:+ start:3453 stop:5270 length:1818 start_codon:yes stop_codon:yes gene_type:complete
MQRSDIRNIAIIAHVDHGKTTLVDSLLKQSGQFRDSQLQEACILDSNDLERERGITILAKNIALNYEGVKINIIDTPGHADFGGEVERVLSMADGALVLVDAFEGPRPQTRFVLSKALEQNLKPLVVINKIDRPDCRPDEVLSQVFDLLVELGASDEVLDFPYVYASGRSGFATHDPKDHTGDIRPLLDMIIQHVPPPTVSMDDPFQMMVTTLQWSKYVGRIATGRILSGKVNTGEKVVLMRADGSRVNSTVEQVEVFNNLGRAAVPQATAGDLVALVGLPDPDIGDTVAHPSITQALPRIKVDEPTISMSFTINSSPFAGKSGKFVTSRHLRDRLMRELQSNVALRVEETDVKECFRVSGRGLLHLSILIEEMRREGYELSVGKPEVIRKEIDGVMHEPFEILSIDVPTELVGGAMELITPRRGQLQDMTSNETGQSHLQFLIPARGLIGLRTRLLNATRGEAVINHRFDSYKPSEGELPGRANGVLISQLPGKSSAYALWKLQDRAEMFVNPGQDIYEGMIVGENSRDNDMVVNPVREKKLTNVRASGSDDAILLKPPRDMSLEIALEYIERDEYVEVTPAAIRLRKIGLTENERKRRPMLVG